MGKAYSHLTLEQREKIKTMLEDGFSKSEIARMLGFNNSTICREIKRGSVEGKYVPDFAEQSYRRQLADKGAQPMFSSNPELAREVARLILTEKLPLTQVAERLQQDERFEQYPKTRITLWRAIEKGLVPGVTLETLRPDTTTVFSDGQVHLAKWLREALDIHDGDELEFSLSGNKIIFTKKDAT